MTSTPTSPTGPRWRALVAGGATVAVVGLVVAAAAVWPGFDAQETPLQDSSVWALQTGDGRNYARVNTALGELVTVKQVENPSRLAQTQGHLFVFTDGDSKYADVLLPSPPDIDADAADVLQPTPSGTSEVSSAGDYLAYLTDTGDVYAARLSTGGAATIIDPYADVVVEQGQTRPRIGADAVTVTDTGTLLALSLASGRMFTADAATGEITDEEEVEIPATDDVQLSRVGGRWAVLEPTSGTLWIQGVDGPVSLDVDENARLQSPDPSAAEVSIADGSGLVTVALDGQNTQRTVEAQGAPAQPTSVGGVLFGAWLTAEAGTLWSSESGATDLDFAGAALDEQLTPVIAANSGQAILNETTSGWVWTLPDGALVASSQSWRSEEAARQQEQDQNVTPDRVLDPRPPVAEPDSFGVRAGRDVVLPVLLNDHDPNEDVLSIIGSSVTGLDPAFGTVRVANESQQLVIEVAAGASGSATFSYRVTDGTTADGLNSEPASVTVSVVPEDVNNAPIWCGGDPGCLATWPSPDVLPGGTVSVDVMEAWVDPDGDPVYLSDATNGTGLGTVAADPAGTVTYQHPDPNTTTALSVQVDVTVSDSRGASSSQPLFISVTPSPQLSADSFALTGELGLPMSVTLDDRVHGTKGAVSLTAVKTLNGSTATVVPNSSGLSFTFTADQPGSHVVQYTVRDDTGEMSATVRITVLDPAEVRISTPPLTAFVRPNEDASIDVLTAVENPSGRVLLVSDLRPEPAAGASLSVDVVAQSLIRVSGTTADGQPGQLGTVRYTVSDGTGDPNATATGELTVILLPSPSAKPPIATDDTVTVRVGSLIDIPVLANDTAPAGALVSIDPSQVVNESDAGLAFATPRVVRYLAPSEPGTYSVAYTIFRLGFPEMTDSARIFITVLPSDTNTAPLPTDLSGRVLSGRAVSIPFDSFGVDPDGDSVVLDRIVTQPAQGSAAISAESNAIVYTSNPGARGQDAFTYQVRDSRGETAVATVRIGILDEASDPSPVTYSDYAQAQAGASNTVVLFPTDNDVDPTGSELQLVDVRPNAQPDTDEYAKLEAMLTSVDTETGQVVLAAGTELGTYSFFYTVRNRSGDTAQGLIVLKVVRTPVPDYPVVQDTILTAESREDLPAGIDVVTGRVTWSGGDISNLTMALWDDSAAFTAQGWSISGEIPEDSTLVPFQLSGTAFNGTEVVTYGFLRIPGDNDIELALRAGFAQIEVNEEGSVDVDMAQAVAVPRGEELVVDGAGVTSTGSRAGQCSLERGTTIRYDAGVGGPWTDTCTVPVRLASQEDPTYLALRVSIIAKAPQPELRAASLSVSPGAEAVYDLQSMTTWNGEPDWASVEYGIEYSGDQFEVTQSGSSLTIVAKDASRPAREEPVTVRILSHPDAAAATLALTVGPAPSTLPKGGTATQQCSQSGGTTSCTIQVIGVVGEVNPLPGTPLTLVSVTNPENCPDVTFTKASATAVTASWASDAPGAADCTGSFSVQDAQQRVSSGDRDGTVILDLQGLPADPARINWTNYTGDTVTLRVVSESTSYPAVSGYRVAGSNGVETTCSATGECAPISATNGEKVTYQAWAVNSTGESRTSSSIVAWAYQAPVAPSGIEAAPVPNPPDGLIAKITVTGIGPTTGAIRLTSPVGETVTVSVPSGQNSVEFPAFLVGSNTPTTVTATPVTRFEVPPESVVAGGSSDGTSVSGEAWGIGAPLITDPTVTASTDGSGQIQVAATVTPNGTGATVKARAVLAGTTCTPSGSVTGSSFSTTLAGTVWEATTVNICAETWYDGVSFGTTSWTSGTVRPSETIPPPTGDTTYSITATADSTVANARVREWSVISAPALAATGSYEVVFFTGGTPVASFNEAFRYNGVAPAPLTAKACLAGSTETCSEPVTISPATGSPAYLVRIEFPATCVSGDVSPGQIVVAAEAGQYSTSASEDGSTGATYSVAFTAALSALDTQSYSLTCTAPDPPPADSGTEGSTTP